MQGNQNADARKFPNDIRRKPSEKSNHINDEKQTDTGNQHPPPNQGNCRKTNQIAQNRRESPKEDGNMKLNVGAADFVH